MDYFVYFDFFMNQYWYHTICFNKEDLNFIPNKQINWSSADYTSLEEWKKRNGYYFRLD